MLLHGITFLSPCHILILRLMIILEINFYTGSSIFNTLETLMRWKRLFFCDLHKAFYWVWHSGYKALLINGNGQKLCWFRFAVSVSIRVHFSFHNGFNMRRKLFFLTHCYILLNNRLNKQLMFTVERCYQ